MPRRAAASWRRGSRASSSDMKLTVSPINSALSPHLKNASRLLKSSFPKNERISVPWLLFGALRKNTHFTAFYDADEFVGLLYTIENAEYYFILYLAVAPQLRCEGIGGEILAYAYGQANGKNIVLNVEPPDPSAPNAEQRKRRIEFYARHGVHDTGYRFFDEGDEYAVLASDTASFDNESYQKFLGGSSSTNKNGKAHDDKGV